MSVILVHKKTLTNSEGLILQALMLFLFLWSHLGSNQGPPDYESGALTN
jgi:hypothetical protein